GKLVWKMRGSPADRKILGNERLINIRPVRGAPVIHDDVLYFAAGIWPFMGTFIYALDPETGETIWANSGNGSRWITQQHGAPSFAGVAPQGYLALTDDRLLIPSGRSVPGAFNAKDGAFLYNQASSRSFGKDSGGYAVTAIAGKFVGRKGVYELADGKPLVSGIDGVWTPDALYAVQGDSISVYSHEVEQDGKRKNLKRIAEAGLKQEVGRAFIKAGSSLYCARNDGTVSAVNVADTNSLSVTWQGKIDGKVWTMLAADDRLFVVSEGGSIFCFGPAKRDVARHVMAQPERPLPSGKVSVATTTIMDHGTDPAGYCVVLGLGDGALVGELLARTTLKLIVVDEDPGRVARFRRRMDDEGLYGTRIAIIIADPFDSGLPPYLAHVVVAAEKLPAMDRENVAALFKILRPYGGVAVLPMKRDALTTLVDSAELQKVEITEVGKLQLLKRVGSLPGSASWSHQYADAANSVISKDRLVKPPFGLLWFGGPTNDEVLPRHGHGPNPQVTGGRIFIEGANMLRALDAYTGRLLWERGLKDVGHYYDNTGHHPGANEIGSNYATTKDAVYILLKEKCLKLDAASGQTLKEFVLPAQDDGTTPNWGSLRVEGDFLVATAEPRGIPIKGDKDVTTNALYASASKILAVLERDTGTLLWTRKAVHGFRHNAVIAAGDRVFCIDKVSPKKEAFLARRGLTPDKTSSLLALDIRTGNTLWQTAEDVFGTWLGYSLEHDVLIQGGASFRDRARDDIGKGIVSYRGKDGDVLWKDLERGYSGPLMLRHRELIENGNGGEALDLFTGKATEWKWKRHYGCNTAIGSEHLLTFRSGAAGYYDITAKSGTGNLGGFKSGCTSNLIPADGLLNAPDYTRTCSCSYQNQTSLALVHMPQAEMWTFGGTETTGRIGINFGAPGDRRDQDGTLWTDFPSVGGEDVKRSITADGGTYYRHHSALFAGSSHPWVAASGVEGVKSVTVSVPGAERLTVRLYFAEQDVAAKAGHRVFGVKANGKELLADFDVVKEAGATRTLVMREFRGVAMGEAGVKLEFVASAGEPIISGLEAIAE
ncbi:MAG: PQQ-binding-like beta-propeller repeat protein, partial [Verrucomicrobia bacterium]|nr:PQQ-binding-like beta-propeller repeat protein [Verrucomicrobiota bacterium]